MSACRTSAALSDVVIQKHTLDFLDSPERLVVPDKPRCLADDRGGNLNGVRRTQAIASAQISSTICHLERDRLPNQMGIGRQKGKNFLNELIVLTSVRLDQNLKKGDRGRDCPGAAMFDPLEEGIAPTAITGMILEKIDKNIGVEADPLTFSGEAS